MYVYVTHVHYYNYPLNVARGKGKSWTFQLKMRVRLVVDDDLIILHKYNSKCNAAENSDFELTYIMKIAVCFLLSPFMIKKSE